MPFVQNRKLTTHHQLILLRFRSGPLAKSFENKQAYSHHPTGLKRHHHGKICGFSTGNDTELLPEGQLIGAEKAKNWQMAWKNQYLGFSENWELGTESGILWRLEDKFDMSFWKQHLVDWEGQ